ncbi:hypothetical protein PIB30_015567 [Stylosanthes scabra]|uniref:Uncharacterized protein n=1 Tax=Stylosanthes scabra TaxID=79078 RepID=A0ABU6Q7U6_9FABA|nr:hypothetical protein [Stylosanthes scabra]
MVEIQGNDPSGVVREVEGAQMPHELNPLYDWVNRDVLGSPCTMTEDYLTELKNSDVIFGGGEEEDHYRVELPRWGERGRKIFGLYEESFHDFKGRYFKVFAVGDHPPFWLTLERDAGRFPSYWSKDAGVNYVPTAYRKLNEEHRMEVTR